MLCGQRLLQLTGTSQGGLCAWRSLRKWVLLPVVALLGSMYLDALSFHGCVVVSDGNWPTLKQNPSSAVKPAPLGSAEWKDAGVDGPAKPGTVSSQPVPLSALGASEKLVGDEFSSPSTGNSLDCSLCPVACTEAKILKV